MEIATIAIYRYSRIRCCEPVDEMKASMWSAAAAPAGIRGTIDKGSDNE